VNIHFIGIGGIGMSALAQFCLHRGDRVTGSDSQIGNVVALLEAQNITVTIPQKAQNVNQDHDLIIYSEAINESNLERQEAQKLNIPQKSYFQYLGEVSKDYQTIAVAGTHGKTTTTGFLAAGLLSANFDATVFVGATLKELGGKNFHAGKNDWLVIEACEYRNNFQFLHPEVLLVTNIELDHVDYYKSEADYKKAFTNLALKAKVIIYHATEPQVQNWINQLQAKCEKEEIQAPKCFSTSGKNVENLKLNLFGQHNQENAALALQCAEFLEEVNLENFKKGLQSFTGASRRQEFLGEKKLSQDSTIKIYDDYGHHPTEIKATLQSLREKYPQQKIGLIFEPHQYSRTKQFFSEFLEAFEDTGSIGLYPIYEARDTEADKKSISLDDFVQSNPEIRKVTTQTDIQKFAESLHDGDILCFMGAGKISQVAHEFLNFKT
jgi:UDP-N-acetylmuramate--alanine ligase